MDKFRAVMGVVIAPFIFEASAVPAATAPTVNLTISPKSIVVGQSATLSWYAANATLCKAAGGAWSGVLGVSSSLTVTPTAAGTYKYPIACTGAGGSVAGSASLQVTSTPYAQPSIGSFTPTSGPAGTVVTITGSGFTGLTAVQIGNVSDAALTVVSDTQVKATVPADAQSGAHGVSVSNPQKVSSSPDSFTVTTASKAVTLTANPTAITLGKSATLNWSSSNVSSCTASGAWSGSLATSGSKSVTPSATGTQVYTLTCTGASGSASGSASVAVTNTTAVPTVSLSANPTSMTLGKSATLLWSTTNATSCTASGAWSGSFATSGSWSVTPTATGTPVYMLTCTGAGGSAKGSASVAVTNTTAVPTVSLSANPTSMTLGKSATLLWSTTNATSCTASGAWSGSFATSGSWSVTPTATGTPVYTLTCTGAGGSAKGSASVAVTNTTAVPTVSLSASPTSITLGKSATLLWSTTNATSCTASGAWSGSFATSGSWSMTPTATGTPVYTLTCTGAGGSAKGSASVAVTNATAVPTVSLATSPASITLGKSSTLTWSSTNATACTASGAWSGSLATSGSKSVTPTVTGTPIYTLACTGAGGSASNTTNLTVTNTTSTAQIVVDGSTKIAPISSRQTGTNMAGFFDITQGGSLSAMKATGARFIRWPGGSNSDAYHWQDNSYCNGMYMNPNSTFDNFVNLILVPGNYEAAITVNYGSNKTCNGGGDPAEAAAWVAYVKAHNYNIHYWTVGNEVFGGWEYDLHTKPWDGTTYANAVSGTSGYYKQMKAQDPTAQIGVVVEGAGWDYWDAWDKTMLPLSTFDFVELHWYAQQPGQESDSYLLNQAPADLKSTISTVRSELTQAGKPATTPILIGEFNSVAFNQGKQTMSIVNALFEGMAFGEVLNNNVQMATWWFGYGGGCNSGGNNSSSLYGWQNFGGYDQISSNWSNCNTGAPTILDGVVLPNGQAANLVSQFAVPGNSMLSTTVASSLPNVRVYSATQGAGYALMLFNLDQSATTSVTVGVSNASGTSFSASSVTYGKKQYDDSKNNVWTGPVSQSLGTVGSTVTVSLPPWSMTVLKMQ